MKPIELHQIAVDNSFLAKKARQDGNEDEAIKYYEIAAKHESKAADYYFEKYDLEPTRSILIRSAAFLNLKAGYIEEAERYIFFGLVNIKDEIIKSELYEALELCIAHKGLSKNQISGNIEYIYGLRRKSLLYILEPKTPEFGKAVTLESITEFSNNYTKSLKAYSKSKFRNYCSEKNTEHENLELAAEKFYKTIQPVVADAAFGSFKFSIASDFITRSGETTDFVSLKSNILIRYHDEVFSKELTDTQIGDYKNEYSPEEIEQIFRPIFNIRSNKTQYRVSYYDRESLKRQYISRSKNTEKVKLLPVREVDKDEIGMLESVIAHYHGSSRKVILRQQLRSSSFDYPSKLIEAKGYAPIMLNEPIIINIEFNNEIGFTLSFDDLDLEVTSTNFNDALAQFYEHFVNLLRKLNYTETLSETEQGYWKVITKLITNPKAIQ